MVRLMAEQWWLVERLGDTAEPTSVTYGTRVIVAPMTDLSARIAVTFGSDPRVRHRFARRVSLLAKAKFGD